MIGDIGDPHLVELEYIAKGRIRMRETEGGDVDLRVDLHGVATHEFAEIDLRPEQVLHLDGEKGVLDLVLHQLHQRIPGSGFAIDHEAILAGYTRA